MNKLVAASLLALAAASAHGQIVAGDSVGGLGTFVDQNTGRVWLRLDNFTDEGADQELAQAQVQGFSIASEADVSELLGTLPLDDGQWSSYAAIMGQSSSRGIIWGAYQGSVPGRVGWAWSFSDEVGWNFASDATTSSQVFSDMDLWAYRTGDAQSPTPEPATWALMLGGFGLIGGALRSRRKAAVSFG